MLPATKIVYAVSLFLLMGFPAASALEISKSFIDKFGIKARSWFPNMEGKVQNGSELDLKGTLGMEDKVLSSISTVAIGSTLSINKWRFGYENYNYTGDKVLTSDYVYNSHSYTAGSSIRAEADIKAVKAMRLPTFSKAGDYSFSWLYGVKAIRMDYTLEADIIKSTTFNAIMPLFGARYETERSKATSYYGEVSAAAISRGSYNLDIEAGFHHKLSSKAIFSGGYRAVVFNALDDNAAARLSLGGPFVQLNYKY